MNNVQATLYQFGTAIRQARGHATLRDYAPRLGIDYSRLSQIENGLAPLTLQNMYAIAAKAGINLTFTIN